MGMFDSIYVAQSLIEKAIEGSDVVLEPDDGYYSFQSKDLDNCLTSFYIMEDGSFSYKYQEHVWVKSKQDHKSSYLENISYPEPVGEEILKPDLRSAYLNFYEIYYTDSERIWITFTAHIKNGKLAEPLTIKEIEKTDLEKEAIEAKKSREEWNKIRSTWQWKLATYLFDFRNRVRRFFYPLIKSLDLFDSYLRSKAKKGTSYENLCNQYSQLF